jgi:hypothetical protein
MDGLSPSPPYRSSSPHLPVGHITSFIWASATHDALADESEALNTQKVMTAVQRIAHNYKMSVA